MGKVCLKLKSLTQPGPLRRSDISRHIVVVKAMMTSHCRLLPQGTYLPGCRGQYADWTGCNLSVTDNSGHLTIQFELAGTQWTRHLVKMDGKVWCSLQEIQVLRWIAEDGDSAEAAAVVEGLSVKHLPRSRYPCIFPHQAAESHEVLELRARQLAVAAIGCAVARFSNWQPLGQCGRLCLAVLSKGSLMLHQSLSAGMARKLVDAKTSLESTLARLSHRLGIRYFWVDRWCIDQASEDDKAQEIPRMRDYYRGASACLVLVGPDAKRFGCVPQQTGVILSASQQLRLNKDGLRSVFSSSWSSRVWTMQEALMSRQTIFAVQGQLIDGDFISELLAYAEWAHNGTTRMCGCYKWNPRLPVVVEPLHIRVNKGELVIIRSIFGGDHQHAELSSSNGMVLMSFEEALAMSAGRSATVAEDQIYGVLGISIGGERVTVEYGKRQPLDWRKMLRKLTDAGMITDRQLAAASVNDLPGMSWLPKSGCSIYGPFLEGERLAAQIPRPPLLWTEKGATVFAIEFAWVDVVKSNHDGAINNRMENINNMPSHRILGSIRVQEILLDVAGTSSGAEFTMRRLEGTHMMLCDISGNQAIAIRVLNFIKYRQGVIGRPKCLYTGSGLEIL
ncbi:hypothetical protein KVR01_000535 [Diaporthe batatas]|uniref:uncharacterized protein n=1 Tax=Diaporthe batatas TaxID=748121 RepID=UPI001D05555C|nr:uncharacterized protein KVR01_000535 [Diaporthe batatas]KAG8169790.1 hypothetical protein KVR01_000535 [Diaporthe batatas]